MAYRLELLDKLDPKDSDRILRVLDALLRDAKLRRLNKNSLGRKRSTPLPVNNSYLHPHEVNPSPGLCGRFRSAKRYTRKNQ
jgi:hypothetical protein